MISASDATALITAEHRTILDDYPWSRRKKDVMINTQAIYSTGTVSITGTAVTGVGTAWTPAMVGSFLRTGAQLFFFQITAYNSPTSLTIESPGQPTVITNSNHSIFTHLYPLPSDWGRVNSCTLDSKLDEWSRQMIDRVDAYRIATANYPDVYSINRLTAQTSAGVYQIEFWPVPTSAVSIRVEYDASNDLVNDTDEPMYRSDILVWKSAESASFFLHGKTGDLAWLALADRYHQRFTETLEGAREDDMGKWSENQYIRDHAWNRGRGDEFWLSHDPLFLR